LNDEKQTQSKPITNAGSDKEWIPAFAGMTNNEIPPRRKFLNIVEKTKPIFNGQNKYKYLYKKEL
jgi:hypothetical protein